MEKETVILTHFSDCLEHLLEDHLVGLSGMLHKHLIENEETLKAAYQHRCDMGGCQVLTNTTNNEDDFMSEFIPAEREAIIYPAESEKIKRNVAPHMAFRVRAAPATETTAEPPQTAFHAVATQTSIAATQGQGMTWEDEEELKKQKARKKCRESRRSLSMDKRTPTSGSPRLRDQAATIVVHSCFQNFFMALIAGNMVVVILQLELARSQHKLMEELFTFQVVHHVFTVLFVIELAARIFASGGTFFLSNPIWGWDYFDLVIVLASVMEPMVSLVFNQNSQQSSQLRSVRVIRVVARVSRLIRAFRLARGFAPLRVMLASLLCSLKSLIWVVLLMLFFMTVFAILFASSVLEYVVSKERASNLLTEDDLRLQASFGSLLSCLLTEYMSISGGDDWNTTARLLGAIEGATRDQTIVIENQMQHAERYAHCLKKLFHDMDDDGGGTITLDELENHLQDEDVKAYFVSLDIDPSDTWTLFSVLDAGSAAEISLEEFIIGCLRLKGSAKAVDMIRVGYENQYLSKQLQNIETHVHCVQLVKEHNCELSV